MPDGSFINAALALYNKLMFNIEAITKLLYKMLLKVGIKTTSVALPLMIGLLISQIYG